MIKVDFKPPDNDDAWNAWVSEAKAAALAMIVAKNADEPIVIDEKLYKRMKNVIFPRFHDKCAYCETDITDTQRGDVEHFRPKNRVTDANDAVIMVEFPGRKDQVAHPGYYWLAYNWKNLLLACQLCNQPSKRGGVLRVKWNRFPVKGFRASVPGQEKKEKPLLIHPFLDSPEPHLTIDHTGVIGYKTDVGRACVEIFDLNRGRLPVRRRKVYTSVVAILTAAVLLRSQIADTKRPREEDKRQLVEYLSDIKAHMVGEAEFSMAGRRAIQDSPNLLKPLASLLA